LHAAVAAAGRVKDCDEVFLIGGADLYAQAFEFADRLHLTEIDADFEGDAHFPNWDRSRWRETAREAHRTEAGLDYSFVTYERK
jgi:dihydrofolate reductase